MEPTGRCRLDPAEQKILHFVARIANLSSHRGVPLNVDRLAFTIFNVTNRAAFGSEVSKAIWSQSSMAPSTKVAPVVFALLVTFLPGADTLAAEGSSVTLTSALASRSLDVGPIGGSTGGAYLVDRGFLFLDGQYVPRPYEFRQEGDCYFINGIDLSLLGIDLSPYVEQAEMRRMSRRGRGRDREGTERNFLARVHSRMLSSLLMYDTVILFPGMCPIKYEGNQEGGEILRVLMDDRRRAFSVGPFPSWQPLDTLTSNAQLRLAECIPQWVASFQPTPQFLADASAQIEFFNGADVANSAAHEGLLRLTAYGYPLTVLMMVLVVLGFGHLLSHHPSEAVFTEDSSAKEFYWSLILIAGLSAVDLAWTILASQAGAMHELNPIGSKMISSPLQLVAFKTGVTGVAIGLLYACRHVALARKASWWCCLVLTLVAARWLLFNSMFLA